MSVIYYNYSSKIIHPISDGSTTAHPYAIFFKLLAKIFPLVRALILPFVASSLSAAACRRPVADEACLM
jgi:hypothetical protein